MIRLFTSDGMETPVPLIDVEDPDWEILVDVLDGDALDDTRADGTAAGWLLDAETIAFLQWNGLSTTAVDALRSKMPNTGFVELSWEELGAEG
jgi:hypothetical protein